MAVSDELLRAIEDFLTDAQGLGYNQPDETNDVYENYVWTLCVEAARRQGASLTFEAIDGSPASTLVFRTAPGAIWSTAQPYTYAVLDFPGCPPLEAHVGIRVAGASRVLHECDVAVLYSEEADLCRFNQVHPRASKVIIAAECKFYASGMQLHLGRGFLGLASDIHRNARYFVTNSNSDSIAKLITYHKLEWESNVLPSAPQSEALLHSLARVYRNFRATY